MSETLSYITIKTVTIENGTIKKASTLKYDAVTASHTDAVIEYLEEYEKGKRIS